MTNTIRLKPKVLLLEDEEDIRELLSHLLEAYGCEPLLASTESQIQDYLSREKISLALLDICLPSEDGRLVAARLRNQGASNPINSLGTLKRPPQDPGQALLELAATMATEQEALRRRQEDSFSKLGSLLSESVMSELRANAKQADELLLRTVRELRDIRQEMLDAKE